MQVSIHPKGKRIIQDCLGDTLWIAGPGIILFLALRWVLPINLVPSSSMEPTIPTGAKVLVNRTPAAVDTLQRGDVVVFDSGYRTGFGKREPVVFLKRLVALPGDTVAIEAGQLIVNDVPIKETYATAMAAPFGRMTVPEGHYFVMGDNREHSYDSRFMGPIPQKAIQGKVSRILAWDEFLVSPNQNGSFALVAN